MVDRHNNSVLVLHERTNNQPINAQLTRHHFMRVAIALCGASSGEVEEASVITLSLFLRWGFRFAALTFPIPRF